MPETTRPGYTNRNGQTVLHPTGDFGTDHGQIIYAIQCSNCGLHYGANGSDIHLRKCPECQGGAPGLHIPTFLLTWRKWEWTNIGDAVASTAAGKPHREMWTIHAHKQVRPGHRVFLLRQGDGARGIVASGYVASTPELRPHWDPDRSNQMVHMVAVDFDSVLHAVDGEILPSQMLTVGPLDSVNWNTQTSGISVRSDAAPILESVWAKWTAHIRTAHTGFSASESWGAGKSHTTKVLFGELLRRSETAEGDAASFDPATIEDGRELTFKQIRDRQGQGRFREALLGAYGCRCAVTGCGIVELLEAAHIFPYRGAATNAVCNGLLLRADIHTLFDLGLIAVKTPSLRIALADGLRGTEYEAFLGKRLRQPVQARFRPSFEALDWHREQSRISKEIEAAAATTTK